VQYPVESFSDSERALLEAHCSNLDRPVFALIDLPETLKGALFARYSRYPGTLRRLLIDEFAGDLPERGAGPQPDEPHEAGRAAQLYERIFVGYGDDSVAQLGGAHVACEWVSNVLTKVLQRPRLGAYLEQSTRYIAYDAPMPTPPGGYRYYSDAELGPAYAAAMDELFSIYSESIPRRRLQESDQSQGARSASRAAARRLAVAHGHLRHRSDLRAADPAPGGAPAARGAPVRSDDPARAANGDPELRGARAAA
jgi:thymidylate synthase ThyX